MSLDVDAVTAENIGAIIGEQFTDLIERLVQEGLDMRREKPITFGDVGRHSRRRPPLLLTVTNVSQGRLELIDSTDPGYADVSVASAVRASAGFPIFFRPIDLLGAGAGRCFVDGGMVANFPLWAFSRTFREKLQQREDYGWLAPRPWLPIGLRVRNESDHVDVSASPAFFRRLAAIASGMARNDMEDRLVAATQTNAMYITQGSSSLPQNPRTGHPIDVLDVDAVTAENIGAIIQTGDDAANRWLVASGNYTIFDRECGPAVGDCLEDMLCRCEHAMHVPPTALNLRSNVFMAVGHRLEMRFSARMTGMRDDGLQFPDLATGVNGWCYQTRSPALCNLDTVLDISGAGSRERRPFNMSMDLQNRIQ